MTTLPNSYYEASLSALRIDYPTLNGNVDCDVCIVGGGFMGLYTALNLQEQGLKVVLLEAQRVGYGASGRNGGHVIPEFGGSQRNFESQLDTQSAQAVWAITHQAADDLRARIAKYDIACDYQEGHLEAAMTDKHVKALKDWQAHARNMYGYEYHSVSHNNMPLYVGSKRYQAGLYDKNGGHLHPLKLALGLVRALVAGGGQVFEQSAVNSWINEANQVRVLTDSGRDSKPNGQVTCECLVLGCNVGMESIQNNASQRLAKRILPVGSWVIATEPLNPELANQVLPSNAAVVDMRFILDYYRLSADKRMVFGGGCSYLGDESPANLKEIMRKKMIQVFPQLTDTKVEFGWGGLIDISMNRMPDFGYAGDDKVLYAQGFSGSGVVATNAAARVISEAITGNTTHLAMFQRISHMPFPGGKLLRAPVTAVGMLYHRLLDLL